VSTYRIPLLAFGIVFTDREEAVTFCLDMYEDDQLNEIDLGLEYFGDYWILGFQMKPGETVDKYQLMWNAYCFDTSIVPEAMLDIRTF
jgi:hypothetical protein